MKHGIRYEEKGQKNFPLILMVKIRHENYDYKLQ